MVCPKCGAKMQEGSNMCIRCGTITYNNDIIVDRNEDGLANRNVYTEPNPNIENQTFISNDIYQDIHDDKSSKIRKILKVYLNCMLAFWCVISIMRAIKLNMSIFDVFIYGTIIIVHVLAKKSVERKTKPSGFISIFLAVFMIIITFNFSIVNIIFGILGIIWIFYSIRYLMIIDKKRNKTILILSITATILSPIIFVMTIGFLVSMNSLNRTSENAAKDASYSIVDAVKLQYVEQLYAQKGDVQYSGNVTDLSLSGQKPESGTWSINKTTGDVEIKDVVFGKYICNGIQYDIKCQKK